MADIVASSSSLSDEDLFPISNPELQNLHSFERNNNDDLVVPIHDRTMERSISQPAPRPNISLQRLSQPVLVVEDSSEDEDTMSLVSRAIRRRSRSFMLLNRSQFGGSMEQENQTGHAITGNDILDVAHLPFATLPSINRSAVLQIPQGRTRQSLRQRRQSVRNLQEQNYIPLPAILDEHNEQLPDGNDSGSDVSSQVSTSSRSTSTIAQSNVDSDSSETMSDATLQLDHSPSNFHSNSSTPTVEEVINEHPSSGRVIVTPPPHASQTQRDFVRPAELADRISNTKRKLSSPEHGDSKKPSLQSSPSVEDEDEGLNCPICFEPWSNSGNHRLTSLKCGHVFGQKCIERWIKDCHQKCPQCNAKARKNDIRIIYAKRLKAIDTTELERALRETDKERSSRRECEMELAKVRMQYHMAVEECNRLKSRVSDLHSQLAVSRSSSSSQSSLKTETSATNNSCSSKQYHFLKSNVIFQPGGCRIMDFHPRTQQFVVSQPSPHARFMNGFGVKKVSGGDLKGGYFTMLHQKAIKDLRFSHLTDHHLLSASQDGSLRITDLMSNAKIHDYKVGKPVWSCCWDRKDRNLIYAGLGNGSLVQFDLRNTSGHLSTMENLNSRCPVVSLYHVPPTASDTFQGRGGLFTGTLEGASFWEDTGSQDNQGASLIADFKPTLLPLEPGSCTGLQYCRETQHCLVTYRPGRSYRSTTHLLCELQCRRRTNDASQLITCNVVDTYTGGQSNKLLTRNALFMLPDESSNSDSLGEKLIACVGDEANRQVHIYDSSRSRAIQSLSSDDGPPLDVAPVHMDATAPMLAVLSQSTLKVFKMA